MTFAEVPGVLFFTRLLDNIKEGHLADPLHSGNQTLAPWKMISFPGARVDYYQAMDALNKPYP
ncbi:gluconate 2-dehydrogenase subunit 3 family protein [Sodalis-like endosymbiont of Proechinophthirus fluctus]|uniref:gluconate 2-dehydrogenase subunit 3 family protein n=1 Tax=Sodalis-like endosymbiont of Proechinophthirus fluctus TaxID=1462730 RepID=UPI000A9BC664|nr:gluconate 2-dehydrogenase subunit 3 family protein [Sodalis-like endosymbiont of Proechinophthirus fluctus]